VLVHYMSSVDDKWMRRQEDEVFEGYVCIGDASECLCTYMNMGHCYYDRRTPSAALSIEITSQRE
jgi:hypothetical protein